MSDIEFVVRLDQETLQDLYDSRYVSPHIKKVFRSATPLPKGHGRLKDVDAFLSKVKADRKHSTYVSSWTADDVLNVLNNSYAPIIIEADKKESNVKKGRVK